MNYCTRNTIVQVIPWPPFPHPLAHPSHFHYKILPMQYTENFFQLNALVICNHAPPPSAPGNSRDFDFLVQQIPVKSPTLQGLLHGKTTAVFPYSLLSFHFTALFVYIKQTLGTSPATAVAKLLSKLRSLPRLSPPSPWGGGPWLQMTYA